MTTDTKIRFAKKEDINQIIYLCEAHAHYEQAQYDRQDKVQQLNNDLFSDTPKLFCLVVESKNGLLGYATYMKQYSTWDACEYIYMDCLYIEEKARSLGIGEMVVRRIQEEGKKLNCKLIQWQTPDFNTRAIKFYDRIGATSKSKERFFLKI